jgi:hypothetical protein
MMAKATVLDDIPVLLLLDTDTLHVRYDCDTPLCDTGVTVLTALFPFLFLADMFRVLALDLSDIHNCGSAVRSNCLVDRMHGYGEIVWW